MDKEDFKRIKQRIDEECWIDIEGNVYRWKGSLREADRYYSLHTQIAIRLNLDPDDVYNSGWIRLNCAAGGTRSCKIPTQAQKETMRKLGYWKINLDDGTFIKF